MTGVSDAMTEQRLRMLDGGFLQIYAGETMLAQMRFDTPAFGPTQDGFAVARPIMVGTGRADGVATQWIAVSPSGVPVVFGLVGDDMLLSQNYISTGAEVRITSFIYQQER